MAYRAPQRITRKDLYDKVWSKAVQQVAAEFGLSGNGLKKACVRLRIPVPPRGYWQAVRSGKRITKPRLPKLAKGSSEETWLSPLADPPVLQSVGDRALESEADRLVDLEQLDDHRLVVPATLTDPHALVAQTRKALAAERSTDNRLDRPQRAYLDCRVAPDSVDRALRIFDTLLKGLESRGHAVEITADTPVPADQTRTHQPQPAVTTYTTQVVINGARIPLHLIEERRTDRQWKANSWGGGSYESIYVPTGKLTLKLEGGTSTIRSTWSDTASQTVESRLNTCVASCIRLADWTIRQRAIARITARQQRRSDRQAKRWEAREKRRREAATRERERLSQRDTDLHHRLGRWMRAMELRAYATAVMTHHAIPTETVAQGTSRLGRWLRWVLDQAQQLETTAYQHPWRPLPDLPRPTAPPAAPSPTPKISDAADHDPFGHYNFWQRQHIFASMHGGRR